VNKEPSSIRRDIVQDWLWPPIQLERRALIAGFHWPLIFTAR
jgi:hypothetical protein